MTTTTIFNIPNVHNTATFPLAALQVNNIKLKMLNWSKQFSIFAFLDSNNYPDKYGKYDCLAAAGAIATANSLDKVQAIHQQENDWLFGHICYDYKNILEPKLSSRHLSFHQFSELQFFVPEIVCYIIKEKNELVILSKTIAPEKIFAAINEQSVDKKEELPKIDFTQKISKEQYIATIEKLRTHIVNGDCYEINFCNEGFCKDAEIPPVEIFNKLNKISPAPFAAFYKNEEQYLICSSPERYLCKHDEKVLSQPIKGTTKRDNEAKKDEAAKEFLRNSIKDRAENVMIVDLVRNDLARCCEIGSIRVDELFGIYSFPQVHQMISTISGKLNKNTPVADAIQYSFPMGSMTGAPKIKVMELIEEYEHSRRELFSGTIGYISPDGDFDFNVIIRSIFYNASTKYLSYQTGGAITYDSNAEQEWEEMRLKAWAMERVFE